MVIELIAAYAGLATDQYVSLLLIRVVAGLGAVLVWATTASLVSQVFDASRRTEATS